MINIIKTIQSALSLHFIIWLICLFSCAELPEKSKSVSAKKIDWKYHVDSLLMPFWMSSDALGDPPGNYPAYRYSNGHVIDPSKLDFEILKPEFQQFYMDNTDSLRRDFVRIKSRQIYGYCIAYHIIGNEDYLLNAKSGLDYLISKNVYTDSSAVTFWDKSGDSHPARLQRNAQDLAYALLAPTIYYYLTRDEEILDIILKTNQFIWKEYYEKSDLTENTKLMKWVLEDFEGDITNIKELLAPLDQLNAYLLLLAKVAPDSLSSIFQNQIEKLAYSIKDNFYSPDYNIFWGRLNKKSFDGNTDFAHGIKTFWMLFVAAHYIHDEALAAFAIKGADQLLKTAYLRETGSWASKYKDSSLVLDKNIMTWEFDELDQMTATLSFQDTSYYSKYLKQTYPYFEKYLINHTVGGTHLGRTESGGILDVGFRTGWWLANFHDLEHSLIGYLSTANYYDDDMELYFAFDEEHMPNKDKINPYHYQAEIVTISSEPFDNVIFEGLLRTKVTFGKIYN